MRTCKFCSTEFLDSVFRKHAANCKANPNYEDRIKRTSKSRTLARIELTLKCENVACGRNFVLSTTTQRKKHRRFCSRSCANSHACSQEQRRAVSQKLKLPFELPCDDATFCCTVRAVKTWRQLTSALNLESKNRIIKHLQDHVRLLNIDTTHFLRSGKKRPEEVLTYRPNQSKMDLHGALFAIGRKYTCAMCHMGPMWNGKRLTLQVDHINGDRFDHRQENLRFLCPNCHSQTDTFAWRNTTKRRHNANQPSH